MKKIKIIVDFEKEEQYLNEMAKQGYLLEKSNSLGIYTFKRAEPQDLSYKVDFRTFSSKSQFEDYLALFHDAGWDHVCGTRSSGSQYFLPRSGKEQTDDIFSDTESKAGRYKRLVVQCSAMSVGAFAYFTILQGAMAGSGGQLWNPSTWYYTQGLWDMQGSLFWVAFLFETPFVLLRVAPLIIFLLSGIIYGYQATKARDLYKNSKKRNHFKK
jgi:hypothetical protein